jgi:hypothetical protein
MPTDSALLPQSSNRNQHSTIKKRGAPKGNLNALKHGFYTSRFSRAELISVKKINPTSLKDEILIIRLLVRRLLDRAAEDLTIEQCYDNLRVACLAGLAITRMLKVEHTLNGPVDEMTLAINEALDQVAIDWGLHEQDQS